MPEAPVALRDYYARWLRCFVSDILHQGKLQVIGAVLSVAILVLQIQFGIIPHSLTVRAWESVLWPYGLLIAALFAYSALRAPLLVEGNLRTDLESELRKPKRAPADEFNYKAAREALKSLPTEAVPALRHLYKHERLTFGTFNPILPPGISGRELHELYSKCQSAGLLSVDQSRSGELTYSIAPGMKKVLGEILFENA
jgi:hypothetical protein